MAAPALVQVEPWRKSQMTLWKQTWKEGVKGDVRDEASRIYCRHGTAWATSSMQDGPPCPGRYIRLLP